MNKLTNTFKLKDKKPFNLADFSDLKPKSNHISINTAFDNTMFETYGAELAFVKAQDHKKVWTYIEGEGDKLQIKSGFHISDRIGYLITELAYEGAPVTFSLED